MNEAGERSEKATAKKRRDARQRGQILKSTEVNTAFSSLLMFGLMLLIWPGFTNQLMTLYTDYLSTAVISSADYQITTPTVQALFRQALINGASILAPILGCAFVGGLVINILQVGFLFTTKPLQPKLERISPLKGFKRIFSMRTFTELIKSLLKISLLGYILYSEYKRMLPDFPNFMGLEIYTSFLKIMNTAFSVALKMCLALGAIAAFDFTFQWFKHEKELRMTKQEVKDEYKLSEGDPQIKAKIRQKQRQMSAMRMMEKVPTADVIITNPTHYAIALKYSEGASGAPIVVAKGLDHMARKIKEMAREYKIELVENKPLAQALYSICEIDDEIPAEFYQAVADILVYVYRQKNQRR